MKAEAELREELTALLAKKAKRSPFLTWGDNGGVCPDRMLNDMEDIHRSREDARIETLKEVLET